METKDLFAEFEMTQQEREEFSRNFDFNKQAKCQDFPSGWGQMDGAGLWT